MTDDQLKHVLTHAVGVEETRLMLEFREQIKSGMTPELYEENMRVHKENIRTVMGQVRKGCSPLIAGEIIVDMLDADKSLKADQRDIWKALVVIAAFEMQEF